MLECLILQPIHEVGPALLRQAGIVPRMAQSPDMAVVAGEVADCIAVATRNAGLSRAAIAAALNLRVIAVQGVGVDPVAIDYATERGIPVINTPFANVQSVAEHAIALLMALVKAIPAADRAVRSGDVAFRYRAPLTELHGQIFGLIGLGRTGQATARLAGGLGMTVLAFSPTRDQATFDEVGARRASTLEEVLETSDVVSLHLTLSPATRGLIGRPELARMKSTAYLINVGRGATIDETALVDALETRRIAGAGLDVFANDALPGDHRLLGLDNVVLTPHIAGSTPTAMERAARTLVRGIIAVMRDEKPDNLVNSEVWPRRWWAQGQIR